MRKSFVSRSLSDNSEIAQNILSACSNHRIFAFYGDLGAGKTSLIKSICLHLGVKAAVTSPTFTIINEYVGEEGPVYHFDFYRLDHEEEGYEFGLDEYFDSGAFCFIEWPQKISTLLPEKIVKVYLSISSEVYRQIELSYG